MQKRAIDIFNNKLFYSNEKYMKAWGKPTPVLPIMQAPLVAVATYELTIAACKANTIGSLGCSNYNADKITEKIRSIKEGLKSDKGFMQPFNINLFVTKDFANYEDVNKSEFQKVGVFVEYLRQRAYNVNFDHAATQLGQVPTRMDADFEAQFNACLEEKVPIFSYTFGVQPKEKVQLLQDQGTIVMGTASCLEEAIILYETGVDAIALQGNEAGGHRSTFIKNEDGEIDFLGKGYNPRRKLLLEVKTGLREYCKVNKKENFPVIFSAGGIISASDIDLDLEGDQAQDGIESCVADGVMIGTGFIATEECERSHEAYKLAQRNLTPEFNKFRNDDEFKISATKSITGRYGNAIINNLVVEMEDFMNINRTSQKDVSYPLLSRLTGKIRRESQDRNDAEHYSLWAGTGAYRLAAGSKDPSLPSINCTVEQYVGKLVQHSKALTD